ncbi:MAG TPA: hypothetical protein ENJ18_18345, partial [Nannocystis exedens]|nr:hypothetical protein [Nannocystis exedens]
MSMSKSKIVTRLSAGLLVLAFGCKPQQAPVRPVDPQAEAAAQEAASKEAASKARADEAALKRAELAALPQLPGITAPAPVVFPTPVISTLANGLEIIVLEDHEMPLVDISLVVKA